MSRRPGVTPSLRLLAVIAAWLVAVTATATLTAQPATAKVAPDGSYSATRTLARAHLSSEGAEQLVDQREVTVNVDRTTQLRGRERVRVTWSGARPSAGRAANPYGENGLNQEYPVVVLQCRGVDDPRPGQEQLRPETCWTSTWRQRSVFLVHQMAAWRHDRHATEDERRTRHGADPFPTASQCSVPSEASFSARITPFVAADGTSYLGCSASTMPPESSVEASFPPAEIAAFSNLDGNGEVSFEVRSNVENASLGCSHKVDCSLVVIPIMGLSCEGGDAQCRRAGTRAAGSTNFLNLGVDTSVSPYLWWSASHWDNRFTVPLSFGLPPDTCDVLDPRPPVGFYGSELLAQAALQWAPAYCLDPDRFKFQHNRMPDEAGFALMSRGEGVAAIVSSAHTVTGDDPVGYAPTAVTGFGVAYSIDLPDNAGELTDLRLNPRLLAKLLTQSYPASALGRGHPGMEENPISMNTDPEFIALNPGLSTSAREAAATVLSLSESSDVIKTLTEYLHSDADARAFVAGTPDPWGMKVNPSYRGLTLPVSEWPLLDDYRPTVQPGTCRFDNNDTPYLTQVAAPVTTLRTIADAMIDAWPHLQTRCEGPFPQEPKYSVGRVARQVYGSRFMLGIVSLGDAARFGLRTASLATDNGRFVAPDRTSLAAGVSVARKKGRCGPFTLRQADLKNRVGAYPGTMILHTAARTSGLAAADAGIVARFLTISGGEGQRPGRGNGQLPEGFLPIVASGATAPLHTANRRVRAAIAAQDGCAVPTRAKPPKKSQGDGDADPVPEVEASAGGQYTVPPSEIPEVPGADEPPVAGPDPAAIIDGQLSTVATQVERSPIGAALLPFLLLLGVLGGLGAGVARVAGAVRGLR